MSTTSAVWYSVELEPVTCGSCGMPFGLPASFVRSRRDDGGSFYCPNGHHISWTAAKEADQLRNELRIQREATERAQQRARENDERAARERRRAWGFKGQLTRVKNRIGHGVCPCCNRSFQNLARHMEKQHPAWAPDAEAADTPKRNEEE